MFFFVREVVAEGCEVAESPLVGPLEAGFVAIQDVEFGAFREAGEGHFHTLHFAHGVLFADAGVEHAGLNRHGAAKTPIGAGDVLDHALLDGIAGLEMLLVLLEQLIEEVRVSFSTTTQRERRPWRKLVSAARCWPSMVTAPWERRPLALELSIRRWEDMDLYS